MLSETKKVIIEAYERGYRVIDGKLYNPSGKQLKTTINKGYHFYTILWFNKRKPVWVHRLVAYQKYGEKILEEGIETRHKDNNKENNLDENIILGTHSQNMMDISKEDRKRMTKKAIKAARLVNKKYDVEKVRKVYTELKSYKKVMEIFGISSKGTLHYILNKKLS